MNVSRFWLAFSLSVFFVIVIIWPVICGNPTSVELHSCTRCHYMVKLNPIKSLNGDQTFSTFKGFTDLMKQASDSETESDYKIRSTCTIEDGVYATFNQSCQVTSELLGKNILVGLDHIKVSVNNVFFVETRCGTNTSTKEFLGAHDFVLSARQCCSVESTARANPSRDVYIFHSCPLRENFISRSREFAKKLLELPNVQVVMVNWSAIFTESPVQELFESGQIEDSLWRTLHYSDVLRLVLLWRFGGTYTDLDTINIRPLDQLKTNYCGWADGNMANGFLNFKHFGFAHDVILYETLKLLNKAFDGKNYAVNGPLLITQMVNRACRISNVTKTLQHWKCNVFVSYHPSVLYPIPYTRWRSLFSAALGRETVETVKKTAFSVHFWNYFSKKTKVDVGSTQAYALLAEEFCPGAYQNSGETF